MFLFDVYVMFITMFVYVMLTVFVPYTLGGVDLEFGTYFNCKLKDRNCKETSWSRKSTPDDNKDFPGGGVMRSMSDGGLMFPFTNHFLDCEPGNCFILIIGKMIIAKILKLKLYFKF